MADDTNIQDRFLIATPAGVVPADYRKRLDFVGEEYKNILGYGDLSSSLFEAMRDELTQAGSNPNYALTFFNGSLATGAPFIWRALNQSQVPLPNTWEAFVDLFRTEFIGNTVGASSPHATSTEGPLYDAFFGNYVARLSETLALSSDFAILNNAEQLITPEVLEQQFKNAFGAFLRTYPYESNGTLGIPNNLEGFLNAWGKFTSSIAKIQSTTPGIGGDDRKGSYEEVYYAFFDDGTTAEFETLLLKFYEEELIKNSLTGAAADGYFIPSQSYNSFVQFIKKEYRKTLFETFLNSETRLEETGFKKTLLLDRILLLLIDMIGILQKVATIQAERLNFLTEWQRAYTLDMASMSQKILGTNSAPYAQPTLPSNASSVDQENAGLIRERRQNVNTAIGTQQESLRNFRSEVGDFAKALQSNVNQSNDAVNQQTNMATSVLQLFSSLLGAIFR